MQNINSLEDLKGAIHELESKQIVEHQLMKAEFNSAYESLDPINLIKTTIGEIGDSEELNKYIINASVDFTAKYLSKKIFEETEHYPFAKLLSNLLVYNTANAIKNNPEILNSIASSLFDVLKNKQKHSK